MYSKSRIDPLYLGVNYPFSRKISASLYRDVSELEIKWEKLREQGQWKDKEKSHS